MDEHAFPPTRFLWLGSAVRYTSIKVIDTIPVINLVIDTITSCIKSIIDTCNACLNHLLFICLVYCMFACSW